MRTPDPDDLVALLLRDEGRAGRGAFWLYLLLAVALAGLFVLLRLNGLPAALHAAFGLALLGPSYCVFAKRFQDIGLSGGLAVPMVAIAAIDIVLAASGPAPAGGWLALARGAWWWAGLANLCAFVVLGLWPGQAGANRYGPRPDL